MTLHIVKLCVGAQRVEDLASWQQQQMRQARRLGLPPRPVCGTRAWPKQARAVLDGGSLYWVIKGVVAVRQRILDISPVTDEHGSRCGLYLDPELVLTDPAPKRAFQGWRYLKPEDAPKDMKDADGGADLPDDLRRALIALGDW